MTDHNSTDRELVRITLSRIGDEWTIVAYQRSEGLRAFEDASTPALAEASRRAPGAGGWSPGGLLEVLGQDLDAREADRLDRRLELVGPRLELAPEPAPIETPRDVVIETRMHRVDLILAPDSDRDRLLEVLEDLAGRPATSMSLASLCGFVEPGAMGGDGRLRVLYAARELERAGTIVMTAHPIRDGDYLIGVRHAVEAIRAAAGDDPRGEADR